MRAWKGAITGVGGLVVAGVLTGASFHPRPKTFTPSPSCSTIYKSKRLTKGKKRFEEPLKGSDTQNDPLVGGSHEMWTVDSFWDGSIVDGKWAGIIRLREFRIKFSWDEKSGSSKLIGKDFRKEDFGCIWFTKTTDDEQDKAATAAVWSQGDKEFPVSAIYCDLGSAKHPHNAPPQVAKVADDCHSGYELTVSYKLGPPTPFTVSFIYHGNFDSELAAAVDAKRASLGPAALTTLGLPATPVLVARASGPGPWYPCTDNGCCRIFN